MIDKKEKTAPNVSVGADTEQSIQKCTNISINDNDENIKCFEEMQRELMLSLDPLYLKTMSMSELYDTVYQSKPPLIDGLLYPGTYIFAGAPKLGKSFLMHSLLTISARVRRFGIIPSEKELCCTLLLKMIITDCRKGCTECLERKVQTICIFLFRQVSLETVSMNSLPSLLMNTPIQN